MEASQPTEQNSASQLDAAALSLLNGLSIADCKKSAEAAYAMGAQPLVLKRINRVKVEVRGDEHGHPHYHISFAGYCASYKISDHSFLVGNVPKHLEELVSTWVRENQSLMAATWNQLNPTLAQAEVLAVAGDDGPPRPGYNWGYGPWQPHQDGPGPSDWSPPQCEHGS